jgi:hypothetical protein
MVVMIIKSILRLRLLSLTALLCAAAGLNAQNTHPYKIHGVVSDALEDSPISNASVYVKNYDHIGTYTGPDGSFELTIPGYAQNDVLTVSSIGYVTQEIPVREIQDTENTRVLLKPMAITLDAVTVRGRRIFDLEKICLQAIKQIPNNYPAKRHYMEGFYRKVSTDSTKFTGLVEAQICIVDQGYKKDPEKLQIQVLNARQADNTIVWDSMLIKMGQKLKFNYHPSAFQSLHRLYESNLIRLYNEPGTFFSIKENSFDNTIKKNSIKTQVALADISIVEGDTILHIDYHWFSPGGERLDAITMAINLRNYAIVEFDRGIFGEQIHLKFKKQSDGRYYPMYIKRVTPVIYDKAKYKRFYNIEIVEVERIEPKSNRKLNSAALEDRAVNFDATRLKYDSLFWENYMKNSPRLIDPEILKSLEKRTTLKQQFSHDKK